MMETAKPINVSAVPQRSPFRYPGGKTWFVPYLRRWLAAIGRKPKILVEPFAGGAIIGLTAAFEDLVDEVVLVEMDSAVAAVWKTILGRNASWLAQRILEFDVTSENVREQLAKPAATTRERAFNTILRNRTFHGGIMAHGSSLTRFGENGKGVASRWYPETLAKRIREINKIKGKITFIEGDGLTVIERYASQPSTSFFVDPPYTASEKKAGKRLYNHSELDHGRLFDLLAEAKGDFLMTYDEDPKVREMATSRGFTVDLVPMQSRRLNTMMEYLISNDATWLEAPINGKGQRMLFS